jgi:hypothetical protein
VSSGDGLQKSKNEVVSGLVSVNTTLITINFD